MLGELQPSSSLRHYVHGPYEGSVQAYLAPELGLWYLKSYFSIWINPWIASNYKF